MVRILDDLEQGDASLLDTLNSYLAGLLIGRHWVPRTDRECRFYWRQQTVNHSASPKPLLHPDPDPINLGFGLSLRIPGCLPYTICEWRPKFGDLWPSRSCRLRLEPLQSRLTLPEAPVFVDNVILKSSLQLTRLRDYIESALRNLPDQLKRLKAFLDQLPHQLMNLLGADPFPQGSPDVAFVRSSEDL
eukprot:scaffold1350_cov249-Pinguiococcus_pyrenoidosus.AAC.23